MRQALAVLLLLFAAGSRADTLLTITARVETTPPQPFPPQFPLESKWQLWVGDHRLREDTPALSSSVIRRFDRKKLYFVNHRAKTYSEVDLPVNPASLGASPQSGKPAAADDTSKEKEPRQKEQMTVTVTDEVRRIGSWNARKVVVVSRGSWGEATQVKWMSTEVGVDEGTLNQWQEEATVLPPGSVDPELLESQRRLNAIPGYCVLLESRSSHGPGEIEFRGHTELASAEKKEPPADLYEPPAGYTKVPFDSSVPALQSSASPATPPPANTAGDQEHRHLLKGYEIYSWQDPADHWHYALLAGTNRLKSPTEILAAAISEAELRSRLATLPALEDVTWCPPAELKMQPPLETPPQQIVGSLLELAHRLNVHLSLCAPEHHGS